MELAPSGTSLSFEVTYDSPSLHVGMSVYDDDGLSPVLIYGPVTMSNVVGNTYRAKFSAQDGKSYIIFKAVYQDALLTTLDSNYSQGSESIKAESLGGGASGGACELIGLVENNNELIGLIEC